MSTLVVVCYDVSTETGAGRRRLRRVADVCEDFGIRVQNSVFECLVDAEQMVRLRALLLKEFEEEEDSLRFYFLGKQWKRRKEHYGAKRTVDVEDPLVI